MSNKNKFSIPLSPEPPKGPRIRTIGPMAAAGREVAENVSAVTEAQVEARKRNAADAKALRMAQEEGLVLSRVPLDEIRMDDLPRDRLELDRVAASDEMDELKSSIRARGQKEPIELYRDARGRLQLKKGWRRVTALKALHDETGDARFSEAVARVDEGQGAEAADRVGLYIDMVEENAVRENLTFAEMASVVIAACDDPRTEFASHDEALGRLYASLHRQKRTYIKQFVLLLAELGEALKWPKAVSRDLGVGVARLLKEKPDYASAIAKLLRGAATPEEQNGYLQEALDKSSRANRSDKAASVAPKLEFRHRDAKVTVRKGECRIKAPEDFGAIPRERLEAAVAAFYAALEE